MLPLLLLGCVDYAITSINDAAIVLAGEPDAALEVADTAGTVYLGDSADTASVEQTETDDPDTASEQPDPDTVQPRIVVWSTEGRRDRDNYLGIFDGLERDPVLAAWDVVVLEAADEGKITAADLAGATQLWIFGTDRDDGGGFSSAEVSVITDFVDRGGGLLVVAEHDDSNYSYVDDVNAVAERYGLSFHDSFREGDDGDVMVPHDPDATLCGGVGRVPVFASVAKLDLIDASVNVGFTIGGLPAMAWRDDGVRVVFDRSWGGWRDTFRGSADQAALVANVAAFLES